MVLTLAIEYGPAYDFLMKEDLEGKINFLL